MANKELELLLNTEVSFLPEEQLDMICRRGTATDEDERRYPCYEVGLSRGSRIPVLAYGERPDGTDFLVCGEGHVIKPDLYELLGKWEPEATWFCYYEHSCGAVLFNRSAEHGLRYLVIEGVGGHIGYPKGHIEAGETILDAVARELREEVGVTDYAYVEQYRVDSHVITKKGRWKDVTYYLAEFDPAQNDLKMQVEELKNVWLLDYETARERVNTDLDRYLIDKAHAMLSTERP